MTKTEVATCCALALFIGTANTFDWAFALGRLARGAPAALILFGLYRTVLHLRRRWISGSWGKPPPDP